SQHSGKVLLVDMDLRKPRLHQLFRESTNPGMTDILRTDHGLEVDFSRYKVSQRIYFVPAGTPSMHPADLLESPRLKAFMTLASSEFDMICVDSPPVLSVPDTVIMGRLVDGAILVLHAGRTNTNDLIRTRDAFSKSGGCEIIGVVMNHFGETNRDRYYEPYLSSTSHDKPAQT
ncbi:MAG: tyrosine-protein kinase family protein, partial [bacterium]